MCNSNVKKLVGYSMDVLKTLGRKSAFNNLKGNKENKIIITNAEEWQADYKEIVEMMTTQVLNKTTMTIYKGFYNVEGEIKKEKFYSPLLYCEAQIIREGDKLKLDYDKDDIEINYSLVSSLLDNDDEKIEVIVNQLMDISNPEEIDILSVLSGLIPSINQLNIKKENLVILAKNSEHIAGMLNELKQIYEMY